LFSLIDGRGIEMCNMRYDYFKWDPVRQKGLNIYMESVYVVVILLFESKHGW